MASVNPSSAMLIFIGVFVLTQACEEFILKPKDNSTIIGRTFEYDFFFKTAIVTEPVGVRHTARVPPQCHQTKDDGTGPQSPFEWTNKFKLISQRGSPLETFGFNNVDSMNDAGLSVSGLYMAKEFSVYEKITNCSYVIPQFQVNEYIAGKYGDVKSLEEDIDAGKFPDVWAEELLGKPIMLHWSITESTGRSIIFEYRNDRTRRVYQNTEGVLTNSPNYDWHQVNAAKYFNFHPEVSKGASTSWPSLIGLPGDFSSPSRFVKASFLKQYSDQQETAIDGVNQAFHIINQLDLTKGTLQLEEYNDHTFWSIVKDLKNKCEYYRDYQDLSIRRICLSDVPNKPAALLMNRSFMEGVQDTSQELKPLELPSEIP